MDEKKIVIILIVIILILAAGIGVQLFSQNAKEPTEIKITSDSSQYEGGELSVELTDSNQTAISKEIVNVTITDVKGNVAVDDVVKTDSDGNAKLDLDLKKGEYTVNVTYGGNEKYGQSNATQKLTIDKEVAEAVSGGSSAGQTGSNTHVVIADDGYYALIDDNGNILEDLGPSKKYYPNDPNAVYYPDAESMGNYIDKSLG